jgi:hypothetical protein
VQIRVAAPPAVPLSFSFQAAPGPSFNLEKVVQAGQICHDEPPKDFWHDKVSMSTRNSNKIIEVKTRCAMNKARLEVRIKNLESKVKGGSIAKNGMFNTGLFNRLYRRYFISAKGGGFMLKGSNGKYTPVSHRNLRPVYQGTNYGLKRLARPNNNRGGAVWGGGRAPVPAPAPAYGGRAPAPRNRNYRARI